MKLVPEQLILCCCKNKKRLHALVQSFPRHVEEIIYEYIICFLEYFCLIPTRNTTYGTNYNEKSSNLQFCACG